MADEQQLAITVAHYPPATSKWNTIEQRQFAFMSINWRATPLTELAVSLELLSPATTAAGLTVTAMKDGNISPTGSSGSKEELDALALVRDTFHGEWNDTISPHAA